MSVNTNNDNFGVLPESKFQNGMKEKILFVKNVVSNENKERIIVLDIIFLLMCYMLKS